MRIDNPSISGSLSFIGGTNSISATSVSLTGSLSGTFEGAFSSTATANISGAFDSVSASLASERLKNTTDTLTGDLTVTGKITAQEFHTEFVSASIIYESGSTQFGNSADDTHIFTGNVGIGSSSPTQKLEVIGNARIDNSAAGDSLLFFGDNPDWYLAYQQSTSHSYWRVGGKHYVEAASGYKAVFDENGNLGIGQLNPIFKLDVTGEVRSTNQITVDSATAFTLRGAGSDTYTVSTIYADSSIASWEAPLTSNSSGASPVPFILSWRGGFASQGGLRLAGSTALYTNDTGLGIGEDTPGHKLDIKGSDAYLVNINNTGGTDARLQFERGGVAYGHMSAGADLFTMYGNPGTSLRFMPGGSTAMLIKAADGNVGIGTTDPLQKLHVNGVDASFGSTAMRLFINRVGTNVSSLIFTTGGPAISNGWAEIGQTDADGDLYFKANPSAANYSTRMVIQGSSGNIGIGTTDPAAGLHLYRPFSSAEAFTLSNTTSGGVTQIGFQQNDADGLHHRAYIRAQKDSNGNIGGKLTFAMRAVGGGIFDAMTIRSNGDVGINTDIPQAKLDVNGPSRVQGLLNSDDCFEFVVGNVGFGNGDTDNAFDVRFGNNSFWGYIEIEVTSTFNFTNASGKLTKVIAVGTNPNGLIYTNEGRIVDTLGTIPNNIAIGNFGWDATNSTFRVVIHKLNTIGNSFRVKVKMFTDGQGAKPVFNSISLSTKYNTTAPSRNYTNYNDKVGIGTSSPSYKLTVDDDSEYGGVLIQGRNAPALTLLDESTGTSKNLIYAQSTTSVQGVLRLSADDNNVGTNSSMEFRVDGTERMRIDSSGRITKPYTPAFLATKFTTPPTAYTGGTTKQTYTTIKHNIGGHYNGTDRFTAPIDGRYLFTVQKALNTYGPSNTIRHPGLELRVNGVSYVDQNIGQSVSSDVSASSYTHFTSTLSTVINLAASDYVEVYFVYSNDYGTHYEYGTEFFMGYLLG